MPTSSTTATSVFIYNGETEVPSNVFSVEFASSVREVPPNAFQGCYKLKYLFLNEGLETIGRRAFRDTNLDRIKLPSTVRKIGPGAFIRCRTLRAVILNEGLREIDECAFYDCTSLVRIEFPCSVVKIGFSAFLRCRALRHVVLNEGIKTIMNGAFCGCRSLERIKLPSTVIEIGRQVFWQCSALREVLFISDEGLPKVGPEAFGQCNSSLVIKFRCVPLQLKSVDCASARLDILNKIHDIPHVSMDNGEILIHGAAPLVGVIESLDQILGLISYYELKEATAIFELALWKAKMMTEEKSMINDDTKREVLRIAVPGPIKDAVSQFYSYNQPW